MLDFLLGDGAGGIDVDGFLKLGQGSVKLAGLAQQLSAMHMRSSSQKTQPLKRRAVSEIPRLEVVSLLVIIVGLLVVLSSLRVFALVV